jgi:protein-disulfide isomerase
LSANSEVIPSKKQIIKYIKNSVIRNPRVKVQDLEIVETKVDDRIKGWKVLFTSMDLMFQKKSIKAPIILFSNGNLLTTELYDVNTSTNFAKVLKPTIPESVYDDEHLLYGNKDAKHKILVFSDPQCPFCQDVMPDIFEAVKKHPDMFALYYYHLPLKRLHPVSETLTKVMHIAQNGNRKDIFEDMYKLDINIRMTNEKKILSKIKKQFNYKLTKEQINAPEVLNSLKADEDTAARLMISGTPTVYIDGKWDRFRDGYKDYLKKEDKK